MSPDVMLTRDGGRYTKPLASRLPTNAYFQASVRADGGGRFQCELTDVDPATVAIGDRVEMTFRRLFTADGIHNYFWKARTLRG